MAACGQNSKLCVFFFKFGSLVQKILNVEKTSLLWSNGADRHISTLNNF